MKPDIEDESTVPLEGRCKQGEAEGRQCNFAASHKGPHWFEGWSIPSPFFATSRPCPSGCPLVDPHEHVNGGVLMSPTWLRAASEESHPKEEPLITPEELVDDLITVAMDVGALKAPDGILRLTDRLAELKAEVLKRLR